MNYFANNEINMHLPAMYSIQSELLMSLLPYEIKGQLWIRDSFALTFGWCSRNTAASALASALNNFNIH